jgi:endonuclease/exonuclease/phosphatase family metal-dependent hydrolase
MLEVTHAVHFDERKKMSIDHAKMNRLPLVVMTCMALAIGGLPCTAKGQPYDVAPRVLRVVTWNVEWMFDDYTGDNRSDLAKEQSAPSREYWEAKLDGVAEVLAGINAHIIALQEIEGDQTLSELSRVLREKHRQSFRMAFIQGSDRFTEQDVGVLVRSGMIAYSRREQSKAMFASEQFYNISKHLFVEMRWNNVDNPLTLLNVHFRATADAEEFRLRQARLARHWLEPALARGEDVIVLGDFNSEAEPGVVERDIAVLAGASSAEPLIDLVSLLPDNRASTHLILDRQFDRIMVSRSMMEDGPGLDWVFQDIRLVQEPIYRGAKDGAEHWSRRLTASPADDLDLSDHYPVVATFKLQ